MNYEYEINKLKSQLQNLQEVVLNMARNSVPTTSKVDDTANQVVSLTPYTETKTAYFGDTECIFYDAPEGNVTVFGIGEYKTNRLANRLYVYFDPLVKQTDITISIS